MNRAQENMIRGGVPLSTGQRTRRVRSATEDMRLNQGVWEIARDLSHLVA